MTKYGCRQDDEPSNDEDAQCLSSARASREFCVLLASYWAVKLTTKHTKDTENFALFFRSAGRLRSGERGLLARSARQLAEHKIPSASCRRLAGEHACATRKQKRTPREKQRLFTITPRIIVEDALLITCVGIALRELRARRDTSC